MIKGNKKAKNSTTRHFYGQVDLHNRPRSNIIMLIEIPHATSCLMAIAMFDLSITVCVIFTMEICMTLTLIFRSRSMRSRTLTIWMKISVDMPTFVIIDASRPSSWSTVTFRDVHTYTTVCMLHRITPLNSVITVQRLVRSK